MGPTGSRANISRCHLALGRGIRHSIDGFHRPWRACRGLDASAGPALDADRLKRRHHRGGRRVDESRRRDLDAPPLEADRFRATSGADHVAFQLGAARDAPVPAPTEVLQDGALCSADGASSDRIARCFRQAGLPASPTGHFSNFDLGFKHAGAASPTDGPRVLARGPCPAPERQAPTFQGPVDFRSS